MAIRLIGEDVRSVSAVRSGKMAVVTAIWESGAIGTFSYLGDAQYHFTATLFGTEGMTSGEVLVNHDTYRTAIGIVLDGMKKGQRQFTDVQLVRPVAIVHAMEQSLATAGATVEIAPLIERALSR